MNVDYTLCKRSCLRFTWLLIALFAAFFLSAQEYYVYSKASVPMQEAKVQQEDQVQSLEEVLKSISSIYKVFFNYEVSLVEGTFVEKPNLDEKRKIEDVISYVLNGTGLRWKRVAADYYLLYKQDRKNKQPLKSLKRELLKNENDELQLPKLSNDTPARIIRPERSSAVSLTTEDLPPAIDIEGRVTGEGGEPLVGVTVLLVGTGTGTVTDFDGYYQISVENEEAVLQFTYTGYEPQEISVGTQREINIQLAVSISDLNEVVVTAFGIEKEKKALSYSVQELDGEKLASVGNTSVVNSLQGKVAGLIVKQTSGAPGSRSRINIRGSRSFTGNNEPLYVVDGMPISSGSRTIDLNPADIKSVNILKGPTAAALYGLRASNGVILIETNKGEGVTGGKPTITLDNSFNFDQISRFPETQTTYAQGTGGNFDPYSAFSWGPRIAEMGTYTNQLDEQEVAAVYDNDGDLFETGGTLNSNLSIANSSQQGNYAINLGLADQQGILRNSSMQRVNVKFAGGYHLSDKLKVNTSINYSNNKVHGVELPWWATFAVPPSYNLRGKPTHVPGSPYQQINFRGQHDNFYWALDNNSNVSNTSRTFGNMSFDYRPLSWLTFNYRLGLDEYATNQKIVNELGSQSGRTDPPSGGRIRNSISEFRQINSNFNLSIKQDIGQDFSLELLAGNEFYDIRSNSVANDGQDIVIGGFHHISNTATQTTTESRSSRRVVGFFGNFSLAWKNALYLTATGRNDVVSNMPASNRSFFYPSIGGSLVFTEFFATPSTFLTFGKIRASVAEVGQAGPAHSVETVFSAGSAAGGFTWPYEGLSAFTQSNRINSSDLQPENTRTLELGFDLRFLNSRLGLNYTYYDSRAEGQIYNVPIAGSTGFSSELRNAGEMRINGHEISLNLKPIETPDILWNIDVNFTTFTNKVISLAEGIEQLNLGGFRVQAIAREGEEFPSLYGLGYARDPATGLVVVDNRPTLANGSPNPFYGMPLRTTESIILGKAQPDFEMGFIQTFAFKNFTLLAQVDWRKGGVLSSGYSRLGRLYGVLSETEDREADYVFPGVKGVYDDGGNLVVEGANDIVIQRGFDFYRRNQDPIRESNIYDATYVRLRELRLSYEVPKSFIGNTFIRTASVYFVGRNLWLSAALPHFDPEMFNNSEAESYNSYPQTKSFGGGIRLTF